jgi:hypothetical protein
MAVVRFPAEVRALSLLHSAQIDFAASAVTGALTSEATFRWYEADHLPPTSAEVRNGGTMPPLPIRLHGVLFI